MVRIVLNSKVSLPKLCLPSDFADMALKQGILSMVSRAEGTLDLPVSAIFQTMTVQQKFFYENKIDISMR